MGYKMDSALVDDFRRKLQQEERSRVTIEKYMRDICAFWKWAGTDTNIDKEIVIAYKEELMQKYAVASVNSMLAALNSFF